MATEGSITLYVGEDKTWTDTVYQADGATPQDITGWAVRFCLYPRGAWRPDDLDPALWALVVKTTGAGIALTAPTLGQMAIALGRADTLGLAPGCYEYLVERTDAGAEALLSRGLASVLSRLG